jgi:NodT family efflux transporter outer membrane factor (OMF) lipoprotein
MTGRARSWVIGLMAATALAGCQLAPEHAPPRVKGPDAWREGPVADAWPGSDWWKGFRSSELDQLLADAEARNNNLQAATARVAEANAQAKIAGAALLPTVGMEADGGALRMANPIAKERHYSYGEADIGVSYEIDFWGKNRAAHSAAKASAAAARYDRDVVRLTIMSSVADTYFQARALRDQVETARSEAAVAQATLDAMRARFRQGVINAQAVATQAALVQSLLAAVGPLEQQLTHTRDALAILTGHSPETFKLDETSALEIATPPLGAALPSELLTHRPDVQRAEAALAASNANITVSRANLLPSFNLAAAGGVGAVSLVSGAGTALGVYNAMGGVTQPIFDGGRLKGQLALSRAQYAELLADYRQTTSQAFADVEDALDAVRQSDAAETSRRRGLDETETAFKMSKAGFAAGALDLTTLQAAQSSELAAQTALDQAHLAHLRSLVLLYQALGGGWSVEQQASQKGRPAA